jgi:hypothetical protein
MKSLIISILKKIGLQVGEKTNAVKTIADYNREVLVKQGRDQFTKLIEKGLSIPVALS